MATPRFDSESLTAAFTEASTRGSDALRQAVSEATLRAMQGRELTLRNIRSTLSGIAEAVANGASGRKGASADTEAMLADVFAGMDAALLKTVEANRRALQQFIDQGVGPQHERMQAAIADLERLEDTFFSALGKAAGTVGGPLRQPWNDALEAMRANGTATGTQATQTVESLMNEARQAVRGSRAAGLRAGKALMDSYAALVSGVLIGMSEGMQAGSGQTSRRATADAGQQADDGADPETPGHSKPARRSRKT